MEVADVIIGAFAVALVAIPVAAGILMWRVEQKVKADKDAEPAEPTYPEVEPPTSPESYHYIARDELDDRCRTDLEALFQKLFKRPPAEDLDAKTGDFVTAYVSDGPEDGAAPKRQAARVLWPRKTYVRARIYGLEPKPDGSRPRVIVDIPRGAIAGIAHMTAL